MLLELGRVSKARLEFTKASKKARDTPIVMLDFIGPHGSRFLDFRGLGWDAKLSATNFVTDVCHMSPKSHRESSSWNFPYLVRLNGSPMSPVCLFYTFVGRRCRCAHLQRTGHRLD